MPQVTVEIRAEHAEVKADTLKLALAKFTDSISRAGYKPTVSLLWEGTPANGARRVETLDRVETVPLTPTAEAPSPSPAAESAEVQEPATTSIVHKGGGYYDVIRDGQIIETVKGKDAAEDAAGL